MLSYYDTCLDDNIINEKYDVRSRRDSLSYDTKWESPGIRNENDMMNNDFLSKSEGSKILQKELSLKDTYFQANLINIGYQLGYIDPSKGKNMFLTGLTERKNILTEYLHQGLNYEEGKDYYIVERSRSKGDSAQGESVKEFIISEVRKGYPVLVGLGKNDSNSGHAAIAYHYDPFEKNLYCNYGWDKPSSHMIPENTDFVNYKSAMTIHFYKKHSHGDNYEINSGGKIEYRCYDQGLDHNIDTCDHLPSDTSYFGYIQLDDSCHGFVCEYCGKKVYENHSYSNVYLGSDHHTYGTCKKCGMNTMIS